MSKQKHILFITPGFPQDEKDSTCIPALQDFLEGFTTTYPNIKLTLVSLQYPAKNNYQWHGIDVIAIGGKNKGGLAKLRTWKKCKKAIRDINQKHSIDLIHSFWMTEAAYIGHQMKKELGVPHIVTIMGQDAAINKYWSKVEATEIIALSNFQADVIKKHHKSNLKIIPWGVKQFDVQSKEKDIDVIGVGSLIEVKNWMKFLDIIADCAKIQQINCIIVGAGDQKDQILSEIERRQIPVKLLGEQTRNKTLELMARSKVLLHTSKFESFGMVLAEAAAQKTCVISTPVGIAKEEPSMHTFENNAQAVELLNELLGTEFKQGEVFNLTVQPVVDAYHQIYSAYID